MPVCKKCMCKKPTSAFAPYYNGKKTMRRICEGCRRVQFYNKRKVRRIEAFKILGEKCVDCGVGSNKHNYVMFDFHHLDPTKKEVKRFTLSMSNERFHREVKKCVLLCANCHRLRHFKEREGKSI